MEKYDVVIIGGGPIGLACGIEAAKSGLNYLIVEKGSLVNSLYNYPYFMHFFSTADRLEIGDIPFLSMQPKPGRNEALEYYRLVAAHYGLKLRLYEKVEDVKQVQQGYLVHTTKSTYQTHNIVVATGFYDIPKKINVPGEELPKVSHYYRDPNYYSFQKLIVIGASNSAVDAALECWRKGAEVTMIVRGPEISHRVKYWVRPDIDNRIKEGSIKAYFNSCVVAIRENEVEAATPEGNIIIPNDFVLALTGYQPDFNFLKGLGINLSEDEKRCPEHDVATMETNQKGIYLAGVVCGGMDTHKWFIENSRVHAEMIMEDILSKQKATVPIE